MNKFRVYSTILFTIFAMVFSAPAMAKKKHKHKSPTYGESVAMSSAKLINRYKTVGQFIKILKPHMKKREFQNFKKTLTSNGVSLKDKLPRVKAKGSKILISQGGYIKIKDAKNFMINGHHFTGTKENISTRFTTIYQKISKKKKSKISALNLLVPRAHAFEDTLGLVATFAAGLGGYYMGPKVGVSGLTGGLLGVGALYLGTELWQSFKSGEVSCSDDGKYQRREKGRNSFLMAKEEQVEIDSAHAASLNLNETCTKDSAATLQKWLEGDPLTRLPANTAEPVVPSGSIYGEG